VGYARGATQQCALIWPTNYILSVRIPGGARPKTGESISAYLSHLNDIRVQLAGTEGAISDEEGAISDEKFLYHIYLTAPEQYQPMLDMMQKWPVDMATIASVSQALRDAEQNKAGREGQ